MGVREQADITSKLVGYVGTFVDAEDAERIYGFLLVTNLRGEPVEFSWSVARRPDVRLWGKERAARATARKLAVKVLEAVAASPSLALFRAPDFPAGMLGVELISDDTVLARVANGNLAVGEGERAEAMGEINVAISDGSEERESIEQLGQRGLLWEPFERGEQALRELLAAEGRPTI